MATRTTNLAADLTALKDDRAFVIDWTHTRQTVITHWNYLRRFWREGIDRPSNRDFGKGPEPTFLCVCDRVLPVYLAQVDHILSQDDIPTNVIFTRVMPPASPGPIRQRLTVTTDENDDVETISAKYLVKYQINPAPEPVLASGSSILSSSFGPSIGRFGVEPQTGIVRARVWNNATNQETNEVFEFKVNPFGDISIYTELVHAGDDAFETTIKKLLINDLYNLQLLCGPCNTSKQEKSFHYYKGYTSSILRGIG